MHNEKLQYKAGEVQKILVLDTILPSTQERERDKGRKKNKKGGKLHKKDHSALLFNF